MNIELPELESADDRVAYLRSEHERVLAELGRRKFKIFVHRAWEFVEPDTPLSWNWHLDLLCEDLEAIERGDVDRQIFNVPPGTMKSLLVNVFFPAWCWARKASRRFASFSYGNHLSIRDNIRLRNLVYSEWYQTHYGVGAYFTHAEDFDPLRDYSAKDEVAFASDQNAKQRFDTTAGGWRIASSVGGVGTGEHPDFIIIDDPTSADEARSETSRQAANDWYDRTISSRGISRGVKIIVVMQRLDENDLTGHLLKKGGWKLTMLPMRYEKCTCPNEDPESTPSPLRCVSHKQDPTRRADPRDPRCEPGELLWPALFSEEKVKRLELDLGPYGAAGQLQQRPAPEGGGLFKREWFKFVSALPNNITRSVRGWDTAGSEGKGDWTVGVKLHETEESNVIVEGVIRGQWSPDGVEKNMKLTADLDGEGIAQREEKEGGSAGLAVIAGRAKLLKGHDYKGVTVTGDKVVRSKPYRAQVEAGNVYLLLTGDPLRDGWIEPYITELTGFPTGAHDDQVDGSSCAYNQLLLEPLRVVAMTW